MAGDAYSIDNARRFGWSSVSGILNSERLRLVDNALVGRRILDAGCGGGAFVAHLVERGFDAVGVDLHDCFLSDARARYPGCKFVSGDITQLPFSSDSFHTALCLDVLEHVDDAAALAELIRVASHRLVLAVPRQNDELAPFGLTFFPYSDRTHLRYYTEESLMNTIRAAAPGATVSVNPELHVPVASLIKFLVESPTGSSKLSPSRLSRRLLLSLIEKASLRKIATGLSAVVDLNKDAGVALSE